jgi:hypothetical protein
VLVSSSCWCCCYCLWLIVESEVERSKEIVLDHWFCILEIRSTATKSEKIWGGALQRYVGLGRVPTKNVGASAFNDTDVILAL